MKNVKKRFIILTLLSILLLLSALVIAMNFVNYVYEIREADALLSFLSRHQGTLPNTEEVPEESLPSQLSTKRLYETRYFSVLLDSNHSILSIDTGTIPSMDKAFASDLAKRTVEKTKSKGFTESYRFYQKNEGENIRITFLDHKQKISACYRFLRFSAVCSIVGFLIISSAIIFFADRLIRPITESYEKQNRFITDAGHEIKTPLTIINANIDILEMEFGKNEGFDEVRMQSERLVSLTEELVLLARMEETEKAERLIEFPVTEVVEEAVAPFRALATNQGLKLHTNFTPMLTLRGDQKAFTRLISILMDNAVKYSSENGTISVTLKKQGRSLILTVCNQTKQPVDPQSLHHVFDRFYRMDASRSSETGGHGIGLSIAQAIVNSHGGKISAWSKKPNSFGITAKFQ